MPLQIASNNLKGMAMSKRPHILITDDDPIMREMLDAVLSDDYEVSVAPGGTEGTEGTERRRAQKSRASLRGSFVP